jgi:hypothetical protein
MQLSKEPTSILQRPHDAYLVRSLPTLACLDFLSHTYDHCSFKLHVTSRQLHEWTRSEKTKHHEQAAKTAKAEHADPCGDNPSRMEAEAAQAETLEGEMDNFQTPLVRRGHLPFLYVCSHG